MPASGARLCRNISPCIICAAVVATSTVNLCGLLAVIIVSAAVGNCTSWARAISGARAGSDSRSSKNKNRRRAGMAFQYQIRKNAFPAKAGTHLSAPVPVEWWIPAFAGNADEKLRLNRTSHDAEYLGGRSNAIQHAAPRHPRRAGARLDRSLDRLCRPAIAH